MYVKNKINSLKIYNLIDKFNPDLIILCATSIIKSRILNRFQNKIINFHAGLTQYYRGAGCNVWAIYYKEFEKIGITIHYVNRDLDDGGIIIQSRPKINFKDNSHTIGIKSYNLGYSLILKCLRFYNTNNFLPSIYKKNLKSIKICKKKDFKKEIILEINKLIATNQLKVNNKKTKINQNYKFSKVVYFILIQNLNNIYTLNILYIKLLIQSHNSKFNKLYEKYLYIRFNS